MCLAHLLRDAKYAIDDGDTVFAPGFRLLLLRAMAIGKRRGMLKDSTLAQYLADLDRRLSRLLSGPAPTNKAARRLFRAMRRDRDDLFRFITRRDVPYTNNACERALRPSVIFRKVTNCFRAEWGAKVYAAAASVMATGRLHGLTALEALRAALAGVPIMRSRDAGSAIRTQLHNILQMIFPNRLIVDFEDVSIVSSSFADEVFGKLFVQLGPLAFMQRVAFRNVDSTVQSLMDRAIQKRVAQAENG